MESAIAAVAGELVSRFISFALNRCCSSSYERSEEKRERLRHLLMRSHTVVEEADARHITNSGMLTQLKVLSEAMYQGYHALDALRFQLDDEFLLRRRKGRARHRPHWRTWKQPWRTAQSSSRFCAGVSACPVGPTTRTSTSGVSCLADTPRSKGSSTSCCSSSQATTAHRLPSSQSSALLRPGRKLWSPTCAPTTGCARNSLRCSI
uniref:Rx N-terminal domain-containing protein n=1 Tax=Zea mays TaxID=4577 RepID=C0P6V0_MAIZE|nr:unknown [Zea mays]